MLYFFTRSSISLAASLVSTALVSRTLRIAAATLATAGYSKTTFGGRTWPFNWISFMTLPRSLVDCNESMPNENKSVVSVILDASSWGTKSATYPLSHSWSSNSESTRVPADL